MELPLNDQLFFMGFSVKPTSELGGSKDNHIVEVHLMCMWWVSHGLYIEKIPKQQSLHIYIYTICSMYGIFTYKTR